MYALALPYQEAVRESSPKVSSSLSMPISETLESLNSCHLPVSKD